MDILYFPDWSSHPVVNLSLGIFGAVVVVQLYYILGVFTRLLFRRSTEPPAQLPAVSVVVCAHNELENLRALLPMLNEQDYPNYEVIVMDDRSWDGTVDFAETEAQAWKHVRFLHIEQEYDHVTPKKYAITTAIRSAKHDIILLTDADCRPTALEDIS